MVLDTSAVLAILLGEPEAVTFSQAIEATPIRLMSTVSVLEAALVIESRKGPNGRRDLDQFLKDGVTEIVAFDPLQVHVAREAFLKFGKGRHPAALNITDCCAYALAMTSGEPLLFKGNDFSQTDVPRVALP